MDFFDLGPTLRQNGLQKVVGIHDFDFSIPPLMCH